MQRRRLNTGRESGLSLIELMIGLVLGLLVVSALFNVYVGTSRSTSFSNGLQTMQENGRHGIATLRQGIRHAGYSPDNALLPFDIDNSSETSIAVRLVADLDCNGISTGAAGIAVNTYALDATKKQITCTGNSATASDMPLIDGVERFRVLYGIDSDGGSERIADQYVAYDKDAIDPFAVSAIRIALLVTSEGAIRSRPAAETHVILDEEHSTNDRVARHVFSTTILLRNGISNLE